MSGADDLFGAAQDVRLFVAYTGAGTLNLDVIAAFIYKIGTLS